MSSASGAPGGQVTLNLTLNTAYPGSSEGLEWTLNSPSPEVASVTTTAGPAAVAAQKSLYCANQTCLLAGLNSSPLSDGVVATVTLTLSAAATGNLVVQVSNPVEALLDGTGGSITSANGMVSVDAISVTVTPTGASLHGAQSLQFSATVAGSANPNVTWTMTPMIGVLSSSGLYTAPQNILGSQTVVVTATSVADPTKSASVTITLLPAVVVSVTPAAASLGASQTQQFTASVNNTSNTVVIWSLLPAIGTLSNGLYTAAASIPTAQTVTITATSVADPTKSFSATVALLPPVTVTLSPPLVSLNPSQTQQFTATVSNTDNTGVTWSRVPAVGTISNGLYTAPSNITTSQIVSVIATSVVDPTKSSTATVTLIAPGSVSLSPASVSLAASQTARFTATVGGTTNTGITWSLTPAVGTISNGLYTAPAAITTAQTVTVNATSVADPGKSGSAQVYLLPPVVVTLNPLTISLENGQVEQFTASVINAENSEVVWSISPQVGSILGGKYTAPQRISETQSVTITATSVADGTKSATAVVTLLPIQVHRKLPHRR